MRTITATEASRNFSELLDAVEHGDSLMITRANRRIAEVRPASRRTGADLVAALADIPPPDEDFERNLAEALAFMIEDEADLWTNA